MTPPVRAMPESRYTVFHAIAAAAAVAYAVSGNFWQTFLHGAFQSPPPAATVAVALAAQAAMFLTLLAALWTSTLFIPRKNAAKRNERPGRYAGALRLALVSFVPVCLAVFFLEWVSVSLLERVFSLKAAGQDLVQWLQPGTYPACLRAALVAFVLLEAPLLEEPLFRGIMFRGFAKAMPAWAAMALSGFMFALVHVNATTFVPLWFLGIAFAWLYRRSGTILAPMAAHFMFNALNLAMVLAGIAS